MIHLVIPGQPMAKARPRRGAHGQFYTPKETIDHEESIAWEARACGVKLTGDGPVRVRARFFSGRIKKQQIPDLDNLLKALLDGLQKGELFHDDSQVIEIHALRFDNQENPRTEVTVELIL